MLFGAASGLAGETVQQAPATDTRVSAGEAAAASPTQSSAGGSRRWTEDHTPAPAPKGAAGAVLTPEQEEMDTALRARVTARWAAMVARDFRRVYKFETPAFREEQPPEEYVRTFGSMVDWREASVYDVEYPSSDTATVTIRLTYSVPGLVGDENAPAVGYVKEKWVYQEPSWWRSQRKESVDFAQPVASPAAEPAN